MTPGEIMRGKRGLIMGVANNRSIAWGIAQACHAQGAELAFTYQGDALKKRVEPLAAELSAKVLGEIPLLMTVRETSDSGRPVVATQPEGIEAQAFRGVARQLLDRNPGLKN